MILLPVLIVLFHDIINTESSLIEYRSELFFHFFKDFVLTEPFADAFNSLDVLGVFLGCEKISRISLLTLGFQVLLIFKNLQDILEVD